MQGTPCTSTPTHVAEQHFFLTEPRSLSCSPTTHLCLPINKRLKCSWFQLGVIMLLYIMVLFITVNELR